MSDAPKTIWVRFEDYSPSILAEAIRKWSISKFDEGTQYTRTDTLGWRDIATAPKREGILVTCGGVPFVAEFDPHGSHVDWFTVNSDDKNRLTLPFWATPTNWQPLPPPPE